MGTFNDDLLTINEIEYPNSIYRFMETRYVDEFFDSGRLMLSTFDRCKRLENGSRRDGREGRNIVVIRDGKSTAIVDIGVGFDCLILCSSLSSNNILPDGTVYDSCLEILDIDKFQRLICAELDKMNIGLQCMTCGKCKYNNHSIASFLDMEDLMTQIKTQHSLDSRLVFPKLLEAGGEDLYYSKSVSYMHEQEFRFVWHLASNVPVDKIFVENKELIQCCRKIVF